MGGSMEGFEPDRMRAWVERQVSFGARRPGSPAGEANAQYLEKELIALGLDRVRSEPIALHAWDLQDHQLEIATDDGWVTFSSFPIPYAKFTGKKAITGELVYASHREIRPKASWKGRIVVTEIAFPQLSANQILKISLGLYDPDQTVEGTTQPATFVRVGWHLYRLAAKAGALGFIGILKDQPGGSCNMFAPYGFREKNIWDKPLPGLWVGKHEGALLRESAKQSRAAKVRIEGKKRPSMTKNVVGEISGTGDKTIVVSCHHDSPFGSPVEDGSGVSVVLALAKYFSEGPKLRHNLVFLFTAGHFYGSLGTRTFLKKYRRHLVPNTTAAISIEHVALQACEDDSGHLIPTGQPELSVIFVPFHRRMAGQVLDVVQRHDIRRTLLLPPEGPLGDYPPTDGGDWHQAGVPAFNFISNPVYLLTSEDDFKWVDWERLPRVAEMFSDLIRRLDLEDPHALRQTDCSGFRLAMKGLRHLAHAKQTWFGLKPVY